jgi:hypothetical protein
MKRELTDDIRHMLDFLEEFDALVSKARDAGDADRENDLCAAESSARRRLRELVGHLLGDMHEGQADMNAEPPF